LNKVEFPKQDSVASPTESYEIRSVKFDGVKFNVWDIAGKANTRSLWSSYYKNGGVDAVLWVVDSADQSKLEESRKCLETQMRDPALANKLLYVLANKQDVEGALSIEELSHKLNIAQYDGKRPHFISGVSAKDGTNVRESMNDLARHLKEHMRATEKAAKEAEKQKAKDS